MCNYIFEYFSYLLAVAQLVLSIAMTVIGSNHSDCKVDVLLWLKVAGGIGIGMSMLHLLMLFCCRPSIDDIGIEWERELRRLIPDDHARPSRNRSTQYQLTTLTFAAVAVTGIVFLIWGSVVFFEPYSAWSYNIEQSGEPIYCNYTVFMCTFTVLIIKWSIATLCICSCCIYVGCNLCWM